MSKLFFILWIFTLAVELVSLQTRLAIFGGMGWLTTIKFTTLPSQIGFIALFAFFCAAFCGLWAWLFWAIGRKLHADETKTQRLCASSWLVILAIDLIFRHKVGELLGNAFSFFDFATGVGGVKRMLEQAFQWYGDVIAKALLAILTLSVLSYLLSKQIFKPKNFAFLDKLPQPILTGIISIALVLGFLFMSVCAPFFPGTHQLLASETMFGATMNAIIQLGTDLDGDGYGAFDLPPDEMPFDGAIHPYAIDIPDDGIDQDCLLGDLNSNAIPIKTRRKIMQMGMDNNMSYEKRKNVILVLMESVRHDMLDATIDGTPVMPNLKSFIDNGAARVDGAFATRGFTQNSVTQTFWGSYFDPGHSLVDDFKTLGYYSAVFSGEDLLDEHFDESLGWNRAGNLIVDPRSIAQNIHRKSTVPARILMDEVESFIADYDSQQPLFLYVFFQDPHFPYQQDNPNTFVDRPIKRSEITAETRPRLWRTYANQVHYLDKAAGRLIQALKDKGIYDDSIVLFISDHGESLFDDGYLLGHGIAISDIMTHCVMAVHGLTNVPPKILSHVDIRKLIFDDFKGERTKYDANPDPVMQFIGATTVPTAISYRYADGRRLTYEFTTRSAWQVNPYASLDKETPKRFLKNESYGDIDEKISPETALIPSLYREAPIDKPLEKENVQDLIRTWEYLQWYHRKD